jgi:hypothetical protein
VAKDAVNNSSALIWSVAELLRGDLKQSEYQKVVRVRRPHYPLRTQTLAL